MKNDGKWYRIKKILLCNDQLEVENAVMIQGLEQAHYRAQDFARVSRISTSALTVRKNDMIGTMIGSLILPQTDEEIIAKYTKPGFYYLESLPIVYGVNLLYLLFPFDKSMEHVLVEIPHRTYYTELGAIRAALNLFSLHSTIASYGSGVFCGVTVENIKSNVRVYQKLR